ncbi:unnamed protein product [Phaeothamnion confervicola]
MQRAPSNERARWPPLASVDLNSWVNALCTNGEGVVAAGCADGMIHILLVVDIRKVRIIQPALRIDAHDAPVCSLSWNLERGLLISGGWDGTARVWDPKDGLCIQILPGHENNVAVLALADGTVVTGSTGVSDSASGGTTGQQIRVWRGTPLTLVQSLANHRAGIRHLCAVGVGGGFASASNDGTVLVWEAGGSGGAGIAPTLLEAPTGAIVFGVDAPAGAGVLAFGDDEGHLVICLEEAPGQPGGGGGNKAPWRSREVLRLGSTVWAVAAHPPPALVFAACADGKIRCCSVDASQALKADVLAAAVGSASGVSVSGAGAGAPSASELNDFAGAHDGQLSAFADAGGCGSVVYQWNAAGRRWRLVGPLLLPARRPQLDGVAYDIVIPVEVDSARLGYLELQLGLNFGDDVATVAEEFCRRHQLGPEYPPQIEAFIRMHFDQLGGGNSG